MRDNKKIAQIIVTISSIVGVLCYFGEIGPDYGYVRMMKLLFHEEFLGITLSFIVMIAVAVLSIVILSKSSQLRLIKTSGYYLLSLKSKVFKGHILCAAMSGLALIFFLSRLGFGGILDVIGTFPVLIIVSLVISIAGNLFTAYLFHTEA